MPSVISRLNVHGALLGVQGIWAQQIKSLSFFRNFVATHSQTVSWLSRSLAGFVAKSCINRGYPSNAGKPGGQVMSLCCKVAYRTRGSAADSGWVIFQSAQNSPTISSLLRHRRVKTRAISSLNHDEDSKHQYSVLQYWQYFKDAIVFLVEFIRVFSSLFWSW